MQQHKGMSLAGEMSDNTVIFATEEHLFSDLGDESVILNLKSGVYLGLNSTGTRIWNLLREPKSFKELKGAILREYAVAPEECERDLRELLEELAGQGLIEFGHDKTP